MSKHILFAVLNWGLGHATRSISVIRTCIEAGHRVTLASDGFPMQFLQQEFPGLRMIELPGYDVSYGHRKLGRHAWMLFRAVQSAMRKEHATVQKLHIQDPVDAVISDNRYGCHIRGVPSALLTHQLNIVGSSKSGNLLGSKAIHHWIKPFDYLWIPDRPDRLLSGEMTHHFDTRIRFIGFLSDLRQVPGTTDYSLACILSGPEPSRTNLERKVKKQLLELNYPAVLIRGVRGRKKQQVEGRLIIQDHLDRNGITQLMRRSEVIICRPGYSSLMDLRAVGKKAILIPTVGQPEQEYLAQRIKRDLRFYYYAVQTENTLNIREGFDRLSRTGDPQAFGGEDYHVAPAIAELMAG